MKEEKQNQKHTNTYGMYIHIVTPEHEKCLNEKRIRTYIITFNYQQYFEVQKCACDTRTIYRQKMLYTEQTINMSICVELCSKSTNTPSKSR